MGSFAATLLQPQSQCHQHHPLLSISSSAIVRRRILFLSDTDTHHHRHCCCERNKKGFEFQVLVYCISLATIGELTVQSAVVLKRLSRKKSPLRRAFKYELKQSCRLRLVVVVVSFRVAYYKKESKGRRRECSSSGVSPMFLLAVHFHRIDDDDGDDSGDW